MLLFLKLNDYEAHMTFRVISSIVKSQIWPSWRWRDTDVISRTKCIRDAFPPTFASQCIPSNEGCECQDSHSFVLVDSARGKRIASGASPIVREICDSRINPDIVRILWIVSASFALCLFTELQRSTSVLRAYVHSTLFHFSYKLHEIKLLLGKLWAWINFNVIYHKFCKSTCDLHDLFQAHYQTR